MATRSELPAAAGEPLADEDLRVLHERIASAVGAICPEWLASCRDDIAQAALWLASDDATFVNGHALVVDGGLIGGRSWSESQLRRSALRQALGLTDD